MASINEILTEILTYADEKYKNFHSKLIPGNDNVIGLRMPYAKEIARRYANTPLGNEFLASLPHRYYDEDIVHALMLGRLKADAGELKRLVSDFLPYVDNWAVCDSMCANLKNFFKKPSQVYDFVLSSLSSEYSFTVRFGIVSLLNYYIDSEHIDTILGECVRLSHLVEDGVGWRKTPLGVSPYNENYYVNMAIAWLLSFCVVKEYSKAVKLFENRLLTKWVHNKAIQKSIESLRIDKATKEYLKTLKL
ncbi:MAG: DNA alkylation repair protein [Clostridia bacterium]|nr:DNA alkylation repair protein [Clostridia bacterium]